MKDFLTRLVEQWRNASGASRGIAVIALTAVAGLVWWMSAAASDPHFKLLYSNQDAQQSAAIQNALAQGGIRYQASQPPGPFVIWVDEAQYYQAQNLVAVSGALASTPEGIQTHATGASSVFQSASERQQSALKREWQELEKQLQELDFVLRAHVSTSIPDSSPIRRTTPPTVAVTLALRGNADLTRAQAQTVAKIVRYRFNVPAENVVISDQSGRSLYDGAGSSEFGGAAASLLEHKTRYEGELVQRTNHLLERVFGPGLAYVVLNTDWSFEQSDRVKESIDPKNVVTVQKTETKTSTPQGGAQPLVDLASGAFGASGSTNAAAAPAPEAKTSETQSTTIAGKETEHVRKSTPELERVTVSLFLDESLRERVTKSEDLAALETSVKNAVGFDPNRDVFSSLITTFAAVQRDDKGQPVLPAPLEPLSAPSPMTELVIQRGVEIASALLFLFVLLKALKGAPKSSKNAGAGGSGASDEGGGVLDADNPKHLEMLAKRQIEELVKKDPEKVGALLSRWIADQETIART